MAFILDIFLIIEVFWKNIFFENFEKNTRWLFLEFVFSKILAKKIVQKCKIWVEYTIKRCILHNWTEIWRLFWIYFGWLSFFLKIYFLKIAWKNTRWWFLEFAFSPIFAKKKAKNVKYGWNILLNVAFYIIGPKFGVYFGYILDNWGFLEKFFLKILKKIQGGNFWNLLILGKDIDK